jgi:hypothetical protein
MDVVINLLHRDTVGKPLDYITQALQPFIDG